MNETNESSELKPIKSKKGHKPDSSTDVEESVNVIDIATSIEEVLNNDAEQPTKQLLKKSKLSELVHPSRIKHKKKNTTAVKPSKVNFKIIGQSKKSSINQF